MMLIDDTFFLVKWPKFTLQSAKSLVSGSAKTENILHHFLLSKGGNGESFKWKLLYPRYSVFFSVNCLGLSASEVAPYPWGLPHNIYLGGPAKLGKISGSVKYLFSCIITLCRHALC